MKLNTRYFLESSLPVPSAVQQLLGVEETTNPERHLRRLTSVVRSAVQYDRTLQKYIINGLANFLVKWKTTDLIELVHLNLDLRDALGGTTGLLRKVNGAIQQGIVEGLVEAGLPINRAEDLGQGAMEFVGFQSLQEFQ